jgi:hypothetical protein
MRVFDSTIDKRYTGRCPYCGEKLVANSWDIDTFQELTYDSLSICPNCGGQVLICVEAMIEPLDCCKDCESYWDDCCELDAPCGNVIAKDVTK